MSLNGRMKPHALYINNPIEDEYGSMIDNYEFLCQVMVAIHFNSMGRVNDDIRYKDCQYLGVSSHKGLDLKKQYKLVPKDGEGAGYFIKSINELTRLSQYLLQAVI
ncbi:hypothetical protein [Anaerotignum propionicum]|uniref:Uncharacterized protein n=1 Tax=Anaerotignum propionicum DSM 1682 TaxID=991789 RepID=A0A0X1U6Y4_ANAPI|nr:hypothetical protein [Anaerotignum propionicum]AMJ40695.1 hypothetical protein CPRO_11000 [Anaerotignum propionicum DSM 1682]SHE89957.1 hypothetical protein SAMN02745151_02129 [[Clostridium] propionicum DSM 1682] [Anaerotignum propionicum DSM 1682]